MSNRMRPFNGVFIQDGALTQVNALSESLTLNSHLPGGKVKPQLRWFSFDINDFLPRFCI